MVASVCVSTQYYFIKQLLNFRKQSNEYEHFENRLHIPLIVYLRRKRASQAEYLVSGNCFTKLSPDVAERWGVKKQDPHFYYYIEMFCSIFTFHNLLLDAGIVLSCMLVTLALGFPSSFICQIEDCIVNSFQQHLPLTSA